MTISQRQIHFTSIAPPGLVDDIVESYRLAAQESGHTTTFAYNTVVPGVLNIVFFCWRLELINLAQLHPHCIIVNFEHLHEKSIYLLPGYRDILKNSYVWEYSETNFHRHKTLGIHTSDHVPLVYQQGAGAELSITHVLPDDQRDIDVYFVGQVNERRLKILQQLQSHGLNVVCGASEPDQRDAYLRRTKVALNMHQFDDSRIVETPRLNILFRNRKAVVCELYPDSELSPGWRNAVVGAAYDGMVKATLMLLKNPAQRAELELSGYEKFCSVAQRTSVDAALARFDQWHRQQPNGETRPVQVATTGRVTVVVASESGQDPALMGTLDSLTRQQQLPDEVLLVADASPDISAASVLFKGWRHVAAISPLDRANAWNQGLTLSQGDYIVFSQAGDICMPDRLKRQAAFLDRHAEIDIVGSWVGSSNTEVAPLKGPELDHEIKAQFLSFSGKFSVGCWMFRQSFLQQKGVRFDAQFSSHDDSHFLYRCAVAGARFASIPAILCEQTQLLSKVGIENQAWLVTGARRELLAAYFPTLTGLEINRLCELYAPQWPSSPSFAADVINLLVKASETPTETLDLVPSTVKRVLRHEAVRLIQLFLNAKLIDSAWIDLQFSFPSTASLLAPASHALYPSKNAGIVAAIA